MPTRQELKSMVCREIDRRRDGIISVATTILDNPELGFREIKTSCLVADALTELGMPVRRGLALTGVKTVAHGGGSGPTVAVLGELDAITVPGHPKADPETGAAYACGHHADIAILIAVAQSAR